MPMWGDQNKIIQNVLTINSRVSILLVKKMLKKSGVYD